MSAPLVILPAEYAAAIVASGKSSGTLTWAKDPGDEVFLIDGFRVANGGGSLHTSALAGDHYLDHATREPDSALWYRVSPDLHQTAILVDSRADTVPIDEFREKVVGGWINPGTAGASVVLTWCEIPDHGPHWFAWVMLASEGVVIPCGLEIADGSEPRLRPLEGHWPLEALGNSKVLVLGAGSIGGAAARALATYGVGNIALCDHDRLLAHNFARHIAPRRDLGRLKVAAIADALTSIDSSINVQQLPRNIIYDADVIRPIIQESDCVLVTTDGIDSRRTANLLARRAATSAVFACVLEDGAFGEIIRVRPPADGCLECQRRGLRDAGVIDPEPGIDLGYGMGGVHRPMTAVGSDLHFVGQLAAKISVATILEAAGNRDQALQGGVATIGLRPKPGHPPPFDIEHAGEIHWSVLPMPYPDCPVCGS